jgi:hypothetical protein
MDYYLHNENNFPSNISDIGMMGVQNYANIGIPPYLGMISNVGINYYPYMTNTVKFTSKLKAQNNGLEFENGDKFIGEFSVVLEKGTIEYKNGDVYEGEFSMSKRNGNGKMIYKNGN